MIHKTLATRHQEAILRQRAGFGWLELGPDSTKTVIILHGITGGKDDMLVLAERYVALGYHVYCPDLPGHGDSAMIHVSEFATLGRWLADFLKEIGVTPDILIGNSFASAVIYSYMQQGMLSPETHVILACPTPRVALLSRLLNGAGQVVPLRFGWWAYNLPLAQRIRIWKLYRGDTTASYAWLVESEARKYSYIAPDVAPKLSSMLFRDNPYDLPSLPQSIQRRTAVVLGDRDNVVTPEARLYLKSILPRARFLSAGSAGHILHFEAADTMITHEPLE